VIFETLEKFKKRVEKIIEKIIENMKNLMGFIHICVMSFGLEPQPQKWISIWASKFLVKTSIPRLRVSKICFKHRNQKYRKWCFKS